MSSNMEIVKTNEKIIDQKSAPLADVAEMFLHMVKKVRAGPNGEGLKKTIRVNVATVCSGTDAPIFALQLIERAALALDLESTVQVNHLYSCEIEPFKQAFIRRNVPSSVAIFRDVVEMALGLDIDGKATTAGGFRATIPDKDVDFFFAGCSCVDFSGLNSDRKSLNAEGIDKHLDMSNIPKVARPVRRNREFEKDLRDSIPKLVESKRHGESTQTFFGAMRLVSHSRPKVVILENVEGAPWDAYANVIFPELGYAARWTKLDTKDYYLPQTRSRGYLIAVNADHFSDPSLAMRMVDAWVDSMKLCKQMASAPVTAFLRAPDDPATVQARYNMENKNMTNSNASISLLRHDKVRFNKRIRGNDHPFSMMEISHGRIVHSCFPMQSWQYYWTRQALRVSDTMDLAVAAGLKVNVDLRYKPYLVDVSQNTDRAPMVVHVKSQVRKVGLIGCITPSGQPIVSNLMRPVTGTEVMALQGMPVDEMTITTESQKNLQDLAGNAMTVTVVGAAALSIIAIMNSHKNGTNDLFTVIDPSDVDKFPGVYLDEPQSQYLLPAPMFQPFEMTGTFSELCDIAKRARRLCFCAYTVSSRDESEQTYVVCVHCGTTACQVCRGNPVHSFDVDLSLRQDLTSAQAKVELSRLLPPMFSLQATDDIVNRLLSPFDRLPEDCIDDGSIEGYREYQAAVHDILSNESVFYFQDIKCTEVITVCYRSDKCLARLVLNETSATLYVYFAPDHPSRAKLLEAFDLDQPVARVSLRVKDEDQVKWDIWINRKIDLLLPVRLTKSEQGDSIIEFGELFFADPYEQYSSILLQLRHHVEQHLDGRFVLRPECGTARDALAVRKGSPHVFFMLHPTPCGDPALDCFVITLDCRKLDPHEYREVLLTVDHRAVVKHHKKWKLPDRFPDPDDEDPKYLPVLWRGFWAPVDPHHLILTSGERPVQNFGCSEAIIRSECPQAKNPAANDSATLAVITSNVPHLPGSDNHLLRMNSRNIQPGSYFITIPPTEVNSFLKKFAFAGLGLHKDSVPKVPEIGHIHDQWIVVETCSHCVVDPPEVYFIDKEIFEDVNEAKEYEETLLSQPKPVYIGARYDELAGLLQVEVRLVPSVLPSKALGYLKQAHKSIPSGRREVEEKANTTFTVQLGHQWLRNVKMAPLTTALVPCSDLNVVGIDAAALVGSGLGPGLQAGGALQPPRFQSQDPRQELLDNQAEAVRWMVWREVVPLPFTECETEEEVVGGLNLRVVGKAQ